MLEIITHPSQILLVAKEPHLVGNGHDGNFFDRFLLCLNQRPLSLFWLKRELGSDVQFAIYSWRSLSPRFMRWFIRPNLGGEALLRLIFALEERSPRFFGENGQYPMIVITKGASPVAGMGNE